MSSTETNVPAKGSPFWQFSLRFYREPAVADACIALQDAAGVDVNLLMFLLWHATQRRAFAAEAVAQLESRIAPWREATVIPLRNVRRALKTPVLVEPATAEAFRTRIKAVELESERLQQEAMYALAKSSHLGEPATAPAQAARASVTAYAAMLKVEFPKPVIDSLLAAFAKLNKEE